MTDTINLTQLTLHNTAEAKKAMTEIECTPAGIAIMQDKAIFKVIKLTNIDTRAANILKQTFLSKGGEVAVSRHCADFSAKSSDVIIMATVHQYKSAIPVLNMQPWKLKQVAALLQAAITDV